MTELNISVGQAFDMFQMARRSENVVEGTLRNYRWTLQLWEQRWPGLSLSEVSPDHVRRFVLWLQGQDDCPAPGSVRSATVHIHFRNVRAFFRWCQADELMSGNPLRNVKAPRVEETLPDVLNEQDAAGLLKRVKGNGDRHAFRDYVIQFFFLQTGVRLAELVALNVGDVHLHDCYARVMGKGRKQRLVPLGTLLPLEVKRYLVKHRSPKNGEQALFVNDYGERLKAKGVQSLVIRDLTAAFGDRLGRTGPHTYRHTACTFMLRQWKDIKRVSIVMGHTNVSTTERYTHLTFGDVLNGDTPLSLEALLQARRVRRRLEGAGGE